MSPLSFFRQVAYDRTREVAVIQTGPGALLPEIVERLRASFPGCRVHVVVREGDGPPREALGGAEIEVARIGARRALVGRLRRRPYDVVALQLAGEPLGDLGLVPFVLRGRSLLAFNRNLDHFPLNAHHLTTLAQHFGAGGLSLPRAALWLVRQLCVRLVVAPLVTAALIADAGWLRLRGWARRRRRAAAEKRRSAQTSLSAGPT